MKKLNLTILLFSLLLNPLYAQESKPFVHEFGVDMTDVFERLFFTESNSSFSTGDYLLLYKYNFDKFSFRTRLGGNIRSSADEGEDIDNNTSNRKSGFREINLAIGLEKSSKFNDKWFYNYGFEGMFHHGYKISTNIGLQGEYPEVIDKTTSYGVILLLGIEYSIRPWLSIGSESSLQFAKHKNGRRYEFETMGNSEPSNGSKNFNMTYRPTSGFFVMIHF